MDWTERHRLQKEWVQELLHNGLTCDEAQDYEGAIHHYRTAIQTIEALLNEKLPAGIEKQCLPIRQELVRHQVNFQERLKVLETLARSKRASQSEGQPSSGGQSGGPWWKMLWGKQSSSSGGYRAQPQDPQRDMLKSTMSTKVPEFAKNEEKKDTNVTYNTRRAEPPVPAQRPAMPPAIAQRAAAPVGPAVSSPAARVPQPSTPSQRPLGAAQGSITEKLKGMGVDVKLFESILNHVTLPGQDSLKWDDILGLDHAKRVLYEAALLPLQRPDLFTGLRKPVKGVLLFGPPGTGKTYLARGLASAANATTFNISASALVSKWVGEGEKMVKALFVAAHELQPSIIFIDEVDSILSSRSDGENEASRRMKTEFMVQMDGFAQSNDLVLVIGATNRPNELDDAILRRFPKRILLPLPNRQAREALLKQLIAQAGPNSITGPQVRELAGVTERYSNSDLTYLCRDASMEPIRELGPKAATIDARKIRELKVEDFFKAARAIRPSASPEIINALNQWNTQYGTT